MSGGELDPREPSTGARQGVGGRPSSGPASTSTHSALLQEREGGRRQNDSCSKQSKEEGKERRLLGM